MLQYLYDNYIINYIFLGLCALGLLTRLIVDVLYKRLLSDSNNLGQARNKTLKHLKMKFETCYKLKIGVNNVDTFVDKSVLHYRFCGILLSTWENFCGQVLYILLLAVPILTVFGVYYECGQDQLLFAGAVGILSSAVLILVDKSINLSSKKRLIHLNLVDYFTNFLQVRLEKEAFFPDLVDQYRKEYFQNTESEKQISVTVHDSVSKEEINRRQEERRRKEEEKRRQAQQRAEEQKRIEEARREEERRRLEERRKLAAKRREEELIRLEEERRALEARRQEAKRKAEELRLANELKEKELEDSNKIIKNLDDDFEPILDDEKEIVEGKAVYEEEYAAEAERIMPSQDEISEKQNTKSPKTKIRTITKQEEKLIEDVLKEFFS
ncbi:MAG TPA: hypothetical protein GXZ28_11070 [Clostridiales bacterium]|nr:hypothetical protein [Clostridiales bacterium]